VIKKYGKLAANVGDEGGFAPPVAGVLEALGCLEQAVSRCGYAQKIVYGLDCAATHLFDIITGATGTNVNDLKFAIVEAAR